MGYSNYPGPLFLSMALKSWRQFGQPSSQFHDHLNSSTPNLLENNLKLQALKKHPLEKELDQGLLHPAFVKKPVLSRPREGRVHGLDMPFIPQHHLYKQSRMIVNPRCISFFGATKATRI